MDKEKILSKITPKDYHNELETILEDKDFSEDAKNLLLSCIYKIEVGYQDYERVKQNVPNKKEYLEEIFTLIKERCHQIEIVKEPMDADSKRHYEVDPLEGKIYLWHPNEKTILYALYQLDDTPIYVEESYRLIRTSLSELLNKGENMNRLEVLRDFNGWNWNTDPSEIPHITIHLVYQNLIYLLGMEFMKQWIHAKERKDYLELAICNLQNQYGTELAETMIRMISKLAILLCVQTNEKEKQYLQEEKVQLEQELERISNKRQLLEEISQKKKDAWNQIKEIDMILNDKEKLEEEYIKRNEELPEYHKIFSLLHLKEILNKKRKKITQKLEEEGKILDPDYYVTYKTKLEEQIALLENIGLDTKEIQKKILEWSVTLQKQIMQCFRIRIEKIKQLEKNQRKEAYKREIYLFRYYQYLYVEPSKCLHQVKELEKNRKQIEQLLIEKAIEQKCIMKLIKDDLRNQELLKVIFETRMIHLENMVIAFMKQDKIIPYLYENEVFEKQLEGEFLRRRTVSKD